MKRIKNIIIYNIPSAVIITCLILMGGCDSNTTTSPVITAPAMPTELSATDGISANVISLEWTIPDGIVSYYKIYRAPVDGSSTGEYVLRKEFHYPELTGEKASFEDDKVSKSKVYSYRVSAVNKGGESDKSTSDTGHADDLSPDLPAPPSGGFLITNNQVHKIYIDWAPVSGITTYYLYRSSTPMGEYSKIGEITDTDGVELEISTGVFYYYSFCDDSTDSDLWTAVVEGQAYYYRISSVNDDGLEGTKSDIINGWFPYQVPGTAPENLSATDGTYSNKITISWDTATGATSYLVYRADPNIDGITCPAPSAGSSYNLMGTVSGTSYDDSDITLGQSYCYTVLSANAAGQSNVYALHDIGNSDVAGTSSPGNPTGITATNDGINEISITWTRADDIASHYLIYRSTDALSGYSAIGIVADSTEEILTWKDGDGSIGSVATDTEYYYKIKAVLYEGEDPANALISESSLTDHGTGKALPTIPGITTVTATKNLYWNRIDVSWTALDRVTSYTLYRKIGSGSWERLAKDMTTTEYIDISNEVVAIWNTNITYRIYGVNSNGASNPGTATVPSDSANFGEDYGTVELKSPSIDAAHTGYRKITISWSPIPGDDNNGSMIYKLYRDGAYYLTITSDSYNGSKYSYLDTNVSAAQKKYTYYVIPFMGTHGGPQSNSDSAGSLW